MFSGFEKWLIQTGLTMLAQDTEATLERQRATYQGIEDGEKIIKGNEQYLQEIRALKSKIEDMEAV
jgi:hypothetical protein